MRIAIIAVASVLGLILAFVPILHEVRDATCMRTTRVSYEEISQFEQQIGISEYFSWKVHEFSDF